MIAANINNSAVSGYSASSWYTKNKDRADLNQFDTFIIWLGTNVGLSTNIDAVVPDVPYFQASTYYDVGAQCKDSLGTVWTCIEAHTSGDSRDNSKWVGDEDTQTAYYRMIIEMIKSQNESCLIVLSKIFSSKTSVSSTNEAIDLFAEKYDCLVIDNSDLGDDLSLHEGKDNPHFGKGGNIFVAHKFVTKISEYLSQNPRNCDFGYRKKE